MRMTGDFGPRKPNFDPRAYPYSLLGMDNSRSHFLMGIYSTVHSNASLLWSCKQRLPMASTKFRISQQLQSSTYIYIPLIPTALRLTVMQCDIFLEA